MKTFTQNEIKERLKILPEDIRETFRIEKARLGFASDRELKYYIKI